MWDGCTGSSINNDESIEQIKKKIFFGGIDSIGRRVICYGEMYARVSCMYVEKFFTPRVSSLVRNGFKRLGKKRITVKVG